MEGMDTRDGGGTGLMARREPLAVGGRKATRRNVTADEIRVSKRDRVNLGFAGLRRARQFNSERAGLQRSPHEYHVCFGIYCDFYQRGRGMNRSLSSLPRKVSRSPRPAAIRRGHHDCPLFQMIRDL